MNIVKNELYKWINKGDNAGEYPMDLALFVDEKIYHLSIDSAKLSFTFESGSHHPNATDDENAVFPMDNGEEINININEYNEFKLKEDGFIFVNKEKKK